MSSRPNESSPIIDPFLYFHSIHPTTAASTESNPPTSSNEPVTVSTTDAAATTITTMPTNSDTNNNKNENPVASPTPSNNNNNINSGRSSSSLLTKLADARKSLFGRSLPNDQPSNLTDENRAFLSYIISEPQPKLEIVQEFENNGAQLNCLTEEGDSAIHLLARLDMQSQESINIIDYIIRQGGDPNRQNDYGWTPAHYALASRNTDLATYLLKVMIDVNVPTSETHNGYPSQTQLLHIAARKNDSVLIRLLIKTYKARINVFDEDGCTPLQICCYENNTDALKALLDNDADFQKGTRLNSHENPISICVKYQNDDCLRTIFENTKTFNWKRYFSQLPRSPLLCDFPTVSAIDLLVEHGLDINATDERSDTLLHYLVRKKDVDYENYFDAFLRNSVDFNRQNRLGRTAFFEALEQRNFPLVSTFLARIELTNMNAVDSLSNTYLHYCKYLEDKNIFQSVLQSNPDSLNAQNRDGQTPLHDAVLCDNLSFAQFLIQQGADLTIVNKEGNTVLHLAAREDNHRICKFIFKHVQVDCTPTNKLGKTPLHLACANEKTAVAMLLIGKLKIEQLNLLDVHGRTPLHECAENLDGSLAKYLIRHGADENAKDLRKNTVLHLSAEKGNLELVRVLTKSPNPNINQLNADGRSPLGLSILYNHDEISRYFLTQESIQVQSTDLRMAMQMNNYEMVKLLIEKDRNCTKVRSSTHGDMIIHIFMRQNLNNLICLETLLSFISDNELLSYLSESSLAYGDNVLHIAAREDTPDALTCFLNISRVKFGFWANMMLTKNNEGKSPMELATEFKHYAVIKLINSKWKESYEYLSHSLRDGHCGVSTTGVTQSKRQCFHCKQTGLIETGQGSVIRPCTKCNVCLYKSTDNSMQVFLALLFSDESSSIALDILDSLIVTNEVSKVVHLYLDHVEPWQEYDRIDLTESSSLLNQLVYTSDNRKNKTRKPKRDQSLSVPLVSAGNNGRTNNNLTVNNSKNPSIPARNSPRSSHSSIGTRFRSDGTEVRSITPLEALYYHERLDLVTHPLIKGLIKWKWDNYAAKHFYWGLFLELLFLILWTCNALIVPFPIRYVYRFPADIWRCFLWAGSLGFLVWAIVHEILDIRFARQRYEDYSMWENERKQQRLDLISKNRYASNTTSQTGKPTAVKTENIPRINEDGNEGEHATVNETSQLSTVASVSGLRSHHSQHHPLPEAVPNIIKGKPTDPPVTQQTPIDVLPTSIINSGGSKRKIPTLVGDEPGLLAKTRSWRILNPLRRFRNRIQAFVESYYMYYSLNNLFDWIVYALCIITTILHFVDVGSHTVGRARAHMYVASVTVICIWFRFMVFFRTVSISARTLRAKIIEIKLGELVIMVRMMFDDIIRFLLVFVFLLAPYAFVFYSVFGGTQIIQEDYEKSPAVCESALLHCDINKISSTQSGSNNLLSEEYQYVFNSSSTKFDEFCLGINDTCRVHEANGFDSFYAMLFSIFRIALVDDIPIDSFNLIDYQFGAFVCGTYLLFTAILSINIFIGLISNALQTEAFSTVEARFLLERIEVILNCEWRLSNRKRLHYQEIIHRYCAPLQLNWKEINFDAYGRSRDEQQAKLFSSFRQTLDKHNVQFDTFRIQMQQRFNDVENQLSRQTGVSTTSKGPEKNVKSEQNKAILDEIERLKELLEESLIRAAGRSHSPTRGLPPILLSQTGLRDQQSDRSPRTNRDVGETENQNKVLNERVTELQLSVNRLHQDVGAIRQILERITPLTTSLVFGRSTTRNK